MKRMVTGLWMGLAVLGAPTLVCSEEQDPIKVLDKAIAAMGGESKLGSVKASTWTSKGTLYFSDNESEFTTRWYTRGEDHFRSDFESEFNGNPYKATLVIKGNKAWRKFGNQVVELENADAKNEKFNFSLQLLPVTLPTLKGQGYKLESVGEEKVDKTPVVILKITNPDGKTFKISFDKESGLPLKLVADIVGFRGQEFIQEIYYSNYKDFDGIKRPIKIVSKRDGQRFLESEITEYKVIDQLPDETFTEPKTD